MPTAENRGSPPGKLPGAALICGSLALTCCMAMALLMAMEHLNQIKLPGCGPGSACATAAAGRWGAIPGIDWPVSFVGLAFYAAVGAAWSASRAGVSVALRLTVRLGAIISLAFIAIMLVERQLCQYCLAAHLAFFAFWVILERAPRSAVGSLRQVRTAAPIFALISAALIPIELMERSAAREAAERDLAESTRRMVESPRPRSKFTEVTVDTPDVPVLSAVTMPGSSSGGDSGFLPDGLTGRHRIGPQKSPMRMVIFSDYQCKDCRRIENEVRLLVEQHDDISLAARHFPMCSDCNPHVPRNMHANACWAARAAEAAAILRGDAGFWQMHRWLFDRRGAFTDRELNDALPGLGYEPSAFVRVMTSEQTLVPVREDIELGVALGLQYTPMIFINGVELRGWQAHNAVKRAITALAASRPAATTAAGDRPPAAIEKYIEDWRRQRVLAQSDNRGWVLGPGDAPVEVVMFGDYREPNCAAADREIRRLASEAGGLRYHYRHYLFNKDCNPGLSSTRFPLACVAARAAEAAGTLGGNDGYWELHTWLFEHQAGLGEAALHEAAVDLGFDRDAFAQAMNSDEASAAISEDVRAGRRLRIRGIPAIFVNGRYVPRWQRDGQSILERIVAAAARE